MGSWNPWAWIGEHRPDITVVVCYELPRRMAGLWQDDVVWLCSTLGQAARRAVLTHEIQHLVRGAPSAAYRQDEERVVDRLAAVKLIELPDLIDAMRVSQQVDELADVLWCDAHSVRVRLDNLDPIEVAEIEHALEDLWLP